MAFEVRNFSRSGKRAGSGKFVILRTSADPESGMALFSDFSLDSQHRDIVARWERSAAAGLAEGGFRFRVAGGGWWRLDGPELSLFGSSARYGGFDRGWLKARLTPGQVFGETRIIIE